MNLVAYCKSCRNPINIKANASSRPDLQMLMGEELKLNCRHCLKPIKVHINDVKAKPNNTMILLGIGGGIVISILLWKFFGLLGTLGLVIPFLIWQYQMKASRLFNSYRIKRK